LPAPVSKKQYRYMMAILHSKKKGTSARGDRVPDSVAEKYVGSKEDKAPEGAPESKGKEDKGGRWDGKKKKDVKKSLEEFIKSNNRKAAGCVVINKEGQILLGKRADSGEWANPGGHVDELEDFQDAALRELREEAGLVGKDPKELMAGHYHGYDSRTFIVEAFKGKVKSNGELMALQWFFPHELPWKEMTAYTRDALKNLMTQKLSKSRELTWLGAEENLAKNIIRNDSGAPSNTVYQLTHGDALKIVGNGTFRFLREAVRGMEDESIREIPVDHYTIHIRKHVNDVYSGRIVDGHKQIHQFTNRSLPAAAAELMSVFEWYLPEDEKELSILEESHLGDDAIEGGLSQLVENYRKHNIVNIYSEMENIREEIRHGNAVDLQQVEQKIMKLFDKLEDTLHSVTDKHNSLSQEAGKAVDELEQKLIMLQNKVDELSKKPVTVQAYSAAPENDKEIHQEYYSYLPRPTVSISPTGHITISFSKDWTHLDRSNFLNDMKARVVKKAGS
jgi:8-oxo-dGTP pyrophosphatase MutT (NUDIX family)